MGFDSEDKVWILSGVARCGVSIPLKMELDFMQIVSFFASYDIGWQGQTFHTYRAKLFAVHQRPHLSKVGNTLAPRNPP
jgi:hypothetical protein